MDNPLIDCNARDAHCPLPCQLFVDKCPWEYQYYTDDQLRAMFNVSTAESPPSSAKNDEVLTTILTLKRIHNFVYLTRDDQQNQ